MNPMKGTAPNLHAANATSVVGNSMAIPGRVNPNSLNINGQLRTFKPQPTAAAAAAAAAAAHAAAAAAAAAAVQQAQAQAAAAHPVSATPPIAAAPVPATSTVSASVSVPIPVPVAAAPASGIPGAPVAGTTVAPPAPLPVTTLPTNTTGAGALNLSGRWSLDREDSDSTNDYLEAMGLPLIARQAADKLDLMVIIHQTPGEFIITRRTRIFTETKTLRFGQEVNIKNNLIKVTGDATHIKTVTQLSQYRGVLLDTRTIDEKGRMHVELQLTLPDKPSVTIHRYFKKTSESTSLENLPPFDISAETAGDVKRKR